MKRQLNKSQMMFISTELDYFESECLVTGKQKEAILERYELKPGLNFIRVVVTIGAILIGLGVLSFIASNWNGLGRVSKLIIIFAGFSGVNFAGYRLSGNYPKTSRSLIYLGTLVYGAGIFLIGQIFNFGGDFTTAFLLWSLGVVPMALQQNDKYLLLFANALFAVYLTGSTNLDFPYAALLAVPALYLAYNHFAKSPLLLFCANLTLLDFILQMCIRYQVSGLYTASIFFCIGISMYVIRNRFQPQILGFQGNALFGVAGVALTFPDLWRILTNVHTSQVSISVVFAILFVVFLFALIRKGSLTSLIFICITIFRFYLDTFALLPKSMFFIIGGLILLAFGFYFERMRKQGEVHI